MCNHENTLPSWLSPNCGNSCTQTYDILWHIASTNEPKKDQKERSERVLMHTISCHR